MKRWIVRSSWMAAGIAALYAVSALAGSALGGPLDPPGAPGWTMQTIDSIPPSWFRMLPADDGAGACTSSRFVCVMDNGEAVLDRETGLVWERDGSRTASDWVNAMNSCYMAYIGGRYGWRVPTMPELATLLTNAVGMLAASPFTNIYPGGPGGSFYWTSTVDPASTSYAYGLSPGYGFGPASKTTTLVQQRALCVRSAEAIATQ